MLGVKYLLFLHIGQTSSASNEYFEFVAFFEEAIIFYCRNLNSYIAKYIYPNLPLDWSRMEEKQKSCVTFQTLCYTRSYCMSNVELKSSIISKNVFTYSFKIIYAFISI